MEKKFKVGIIGCGGIANGKHLKALKALDNVEIVSQGYHFSAIPMAPSTALSIRSPEEAYRFQIDPAAPAGLEAME